MLSKKIHPMLMTRGVPGTHDIEMMLNFFKKAKSKTLEILNYQISIKPLMIEPIKTNGIN